MGTRKKGAKRDDDTTVIKNKSQNPLAARIGGGSVNKANNHVKKNNNKLALLFGTTRDKVAVSKPIPKPVLKPVLKPTVFKKQKKKEKDPVAKKPPPPLPPPVVAKTVRISNLAPGTTQQDIGAFLSRMSSDIIACRVKDDVNIHKQECVTVDVDFKSSSGATTCISSINGAIADSRVLTAREVGGHHEEQDNLVPVLYSDLLVRKGRGFR